MIITLFIDGSDQITASVHQKSGQVFYQTLHLKKTAADIISQIEDFLPPSSKRLIYNEIAINSKNKHICYKILHLVNKAVNHFNARRVSHIDIVPIHLNRSVEHAQNHIENIKPKCPYFYNQCLYHYDIDKNIYSNNC